jgi:hypothetical protein
VDELNLEWIESGSLKTQRVIPNQPSKSPGVIRLGRDPGQCDIVLGDGTVSGLHLEIYYDANSRRFFARNLRESNPAIINGQPLTQGEIPLQPENTIQLGRLQVRAIAMGTTTAPVPQPQPSYAPPQPPNIPPSTEIQNLGAPPPSLNTPYPTGSVPGSVPGGGLDGVGGVPSYPYGQPNYQAPYGNVPVPPPGAATNPYLSGSTPAQSGGKKWLWLLLIPALLVVGGLGWAVTRTASDPDPEPTPTATTTDQADSTGRMGQLSTYEHPSGLFKVLVPEDWKRNDNSKSDEVIVGWTSPNSDSSVIVDIFSSDQKFSQDELGDLGVKIVKSFFEDLPEFRHADPESQPDGSVRVRWSVKDGNDQLAGATYIEQVNDKIALLSAWLPEEDKNDEDILGEINQVIESYEVDGTVDIP